MIRFLQLKVCRVVERAGHGRWARLDDRHDRLQGRLQDQLTRPYFPISSEGAPVSPDSTHTHTRGGMPSLLLIMTASVPVIPFRRRNTIRTRRQPPAAATEIDGPPIGLFAREVKGKRDSARHNDNKKSVSRRHPRHDDNNKKKPKGLDG